MYVSYGIKQNYTVEVLQSFVDILQLHVLNGWQF